MRNTSSLQIMKKKSPVEILYCPTDKMTGDFMTKPLQGRKYVTLDGAIMGLIDKRAIVKC